MCRTPPFCSITVQLPFDEVHPVADLVLDCIDVIQEVDLPLLMLPAVVVCNLRLSSLLFFHLRLEPGGTNQSLEGQIKLTVTNNMLKKKNKQTFESHSN